MIKPKKMSKVLIVGSKDVLEKTINTLYDLKIIHIIDYMGQEEGFEMGKPSKHSSIFSEYILSLRALKDVLNLPGKGADHDIGSFEFSNDFKQRLEQLENNVMVRRKKLDDIQILLTDIEKIDDVDELSKLGLSEDVHHIMMDLIASKPNLIQEKDELEQELHSIHNEYRSFILTAEDFLAREIEKAETPLRLATTDNTFLIEGWVPAEKVECAQDTLKRETDDNTFLIELESVDGEMPTCADTPKPFKPFDAIVDMYATPRHDEISPTLLIAFTFPLFYGIMLGDLGYGISLLGLVLFLKTRFTTPGWKSLLNVLQYSSYYTMAFGVVYGEFFGFELFNILGIHTIAGLHMPLAHRLDEIIPLLVASVGIGVVHLTMGYVLGFINVYRNTGLKHAIFEKGSWIGIMYCLIGILVFPAYLYAFAAVLVLCLALLYLGEGLQGIIEIFSLISNLVSYTRLLAIGLSSVGIALALNKVVFDVIMPMGTVYGVVGIPLLICGHTLNLALGILASFLHSIRLQYVEFFNKFYQGGGVRFMPLGIKKEEV